MADDVDGLDASDTKAARQAALGEIAAFEREQLRVLLEHVRDGFARLDRDEIDEFDLDDLIFRYKKATKKLWFFCGNSRGDRLHAAHALADLRGRGEEPPDWWAATDRRQD